MKKLVIMWVLPQSQEDCRTMTRKWLREREQEIFKTVKEFFQRDDIEIYDSVGTDKTECVPVDPDTSNFREWFCEWRIDRMKNADIIYFPENYNKSTISKGEVDYAIEHDMTFMTPDFAYYKTEDFGDVIAPIC